VIKRQQASRRTRDARFDVPSRAGRDWFERIPSRTFPNRKLPGQMGNVRVTVQSMRVAAVYPAENLIAIEGGVPGHDSSMVIIRPAIKKKNAKK